jgi:uncharacterized membrane protein YfcA
MLMSFSRENTFNWDTVGVGASALCVIHCTLTPVLLALSPTVSHFLPGSETVHRGFAYFLTAIGFTAFRAGYKVHRKKSVLLLLLAGISGISVGAYADSLLPSHAWEVGITFVGSAFLISAHLLNKTFCRACRTCAEDNEKKARIERLSS